VELFRIFGVVDMKDNASPAIDKVEKKADGFAGTLGKIGPVAAGVGLALGGILVANIKAGVDGLSEYQDKTAQLDAVLKSTGGAAGVTSQQVKALADQMQLNTKFTAEAALETSNLLLTFTNIGSGVFDDTVRIAGDMATALGTDMSAASIQLGKALNNPTEGLTALTRVGVTFTEEQKNLITSMQESGDMAGAQAVILQELQKEFGGSAEAAGKTFSGQLEILKNSFGEVQESIAAGLMPYLQEFLDFVITNMPQIQEFITKAMDASNESFTRVWQIVDRLIKIFQQLYKVIEPLMPAMSAIIQVAMQNINGYIDGTLTIIESLIKAMQSAIDITKAFMNLEGASSKGGRLAEEGLRGYANGGRFSAGKLMRVGESGPELVAFGASGTVIPNRAMSGGNTTVNNYITVNDGFNGVKRELNRMGLSTP
jgi:hypothetical protein